MRRLNRLKVSGAVALTESTEMAMPGNNVSFGVELITPITMEYGLRFVIQKAAAPSARALCRKSSSKSCLSRLVAAGDFHRKISREQLGEEI